MVDDDPDPPGSPLRAVVGLAAIVGLILVVVFIVRQLQHAASIQDCVAAGRTNCAPIEAPRQ